MSVIEAAPTPEAAALETPAPANRPGIKQRRGALLWSAALLTFATAVIHVAAAVDHMPTHVPWGVFFVGLVAAQAALAIAVLTVPSRRLFIAGAIGTAVVIGIWLTSRTVGVPIAPVPWRPEPVGLLDLLATLMEAISVLLFLLLIRRPRRIKRRGPIRIAVATIPAGLLTVLAGWLGVGSALNPMPVAFSAAPPTPASVSMVNFVEAAGSQPVKAFALTARVASVGGRTAWTYDGTVPGPELHVTQGDRVRVTLVNRLPDATSIHWHGIVVPNAEDGVAGIIQDAVRPGASYTYEFVARDSGTYWYHSHQDTSSQLPLGLFGSIVVAPHVGGVGADRDYSLMIHFLPGSGTAAVNGEPNLHLDARPGETVRLRLINAIQGTGFSADGLVQTAALLGAPYSIVALDGHDLNQPDELGPERIPLGMGQRADLVFKMPAAGAVRLVGLKGMEPSWPWDPRQSTASVTIGDGPAPTAVDTGSLPRFDLTRYGRPAPDRVLDAAGFDVTQQIVLAGGPAFRNGSFDFADTFNAKASPFIPPIRVHEGDLVRLRIVNRSPGSHPIHIHGHVFSVLARNGQGISGSPVHLDAILVGPGETWEVGFVADNPGIWMLHCHVLIHAAGGMSMTVNYDGISTPFTMGSRSGNVPE